LLLSIESVECCPDAAPGRCGEIGWWRIFITINFAMAEQKSIISNNSSNKEVDAIILTVFTGGKPLLDRL
jgi:hypothetical protein